MLRHQYPLNSGSFHLERIPMNGSTLQRASYRRKMIESPSINAYNNRSYINNTQADSVSVNRWSPIFAEEDEAPSRFQHRLEYARQSSNSRRCREPTTRPDSVSTVLVCPPDGTNSERALHRNAFQENIDLGPVNATRQSNGLFPLQSTSVVTIILSLLVIAVPSMFVATLSMMLYLNLTNEANDSGQFSAAEMAMLQVQGKKANEIGSDLISSHDFVNEKLFRNLASGLSIVAVSFAMCSSFSAVTECYIILKFLHNFNCFTSDRRSGIARYRRSSIYLRFVTHGGFFISVPLYLLAILIHWQSQHFLSYDTFRTVTNAVCTVLVSIALLLCLAYLCLAVYSISCGPLSYRATMTSRNKVGVLSNSLAESEKHLIFDKNFSTLV